MLSYKILAWVDIAFFAFCAVMSWRAGQGNVSPVFLFFGALGLLMLAMASHIKLSEEYISVFSPFAEYRMAWSEVEWLEVGTQGTFVFHGKGGKRLVLPAASMWSGKQKPDAYEFLGNQIDELRVNVVPSNTADYKIHKNVKVQNA
jgi:hypothetical protein